MSEGKAGFTCTASEAKERPGGRDWTIRNGSTVEFTDGSRQCCDWNKGLYMNADPALSARRVVGEIAWRTQ